MFLRQCFSKSLLRLGAPFGPVLSSSASPPGFQCVASRLDLRITGYLRILNCRFLCSQVRPSYGSLPQYCDVTFRTFSQPAWGTRRSPIKGNVKRNISPSARCRNFFVSRHSAQLFERALSRDARVVFLRPSRLFRSGV